MMLSVATCPGALRRLKEAKIRLAKKVKKAAQEQEATAAAA
jgi:hypothetical protein